MRVVVSYLDGSSWTVDAAAEPELTMNGYLVRLSDGRAALLPPIHVRAFLVGEAREAERPSSDTRAPVPDHCGRGDHFNQVQLDGRRMCADCGQPMEVS